LSFRLSHNHNVVIDRTTIIPSLIWKQKTRVSFGNGGFFVYLNLLIITYFTIIYGFTLIELIVVIAILAILVLIAVPRLSGFSAAAREKADYATAATIGHAAQAWVAMDEENNTATTVDDLETAKLLNEGTKPPQSTDGAWEITITDGVPRNKSIFE